MQDIYMDYNATTPLRDDVAELMQSVLRESYGNPSSVHLSGRKAKVYIDDAREQVAAGFGGKPSEIIFTSGGSESNNLAIKGVAASRSGGHIITTTVEHPSVLNTCRYLESHGFSVTYLSVDSAGRISIDELKDAIHKNTILISVIWANNETGVVQPVDDIARIARDKGVLFHTDGVQAFGKLPVDLCRTPVDLMSISGHKVYAPKGVGALYVRRGLSLDPLIHGGGQEKGLRSGTSNVAGIAAIGLASERVLSELSEEAARLADLRNRMEERILSTIPGARVNGGGSDRLPNTSNIAFQGVEGEAVLFGLDEHGIATSSASACAAEETDPSYVLTEMGLTMTEAMGSLRFSLGKYSTDDHVDILLDVLPGVVELLRKLMPGQD